MTYPWLRFYVEAVHDRKLRRLKSEHRWLFVACLCAARESPKPGWLMIGDTPMQRDDLADYAGMSKRAVRDGMAALTAAGLVGSGGNCWCVPKWDERQFESDISTERVRRHRERKRNVSSAVSVTAPDTERDTDTEREGAQPVDNPRAGTLRSLVKAHFDARNKRIAGHELDALAADLEREGFTAETVLGVLGACVYPSDVRNRLKSLVPTRSIPPDDPRPPLPTWEPDEAITRECDPETGRAGARAILDSLRNRATEDD